MIGAVLSATLAWQQHAELAAANPRHGLVPLLVLSCALLSVLSLPMQRRAIMQEPEPMDEGNSAALSRAYRELCSTKLRGHGVHSLVMLVMLLGAALACLGLPGWSNQQGVIGAVLGTLVGVGGAAFGVPMSNRRMRINRLLSELTES